MQAAASDEKPWQAIAHRYPSDEFGDLAPSLVAWWTDEMGFEAKSTARRLGVFTPGADTQWSVMEYEFTAPAGASVPCWYNANAREVVKLSETSPPAEDGRLYLNHLVMRLLLIPAFLFCVVMFVPCVPSLRPTHEVSGTSPLFFALKERVLSTWQR